MKPSELIAVLQRAIDAGIDDECEIIFDVDARQYDVHFIRVDNAFFEKTILSRNPVVMLHSSSTAGMRSTP